MKNIFTLIALVFSITTYSQVDTLKVMQLEGVSVTGVRSDSKTPVSQTTISQSDIEKTYQGEEVAKILDKTPSVTFSSDGGHPQGYTYFRLRGVDQTRINMTLNGVPLNEPEDQGVYFSNYPGFTNNIKSAQIQRGVGTSTNGVSSYGGSINFESMDGLLENSEIEFGYGSFNTMRFNATHSTGLLSNKLALYTNFSTFYTDGYKYNSGSEGYSFFMSGGYYGTKDIIKFTAFSGSSINGMAWNATSEDDIRIDPRINYNTIKEDDKFMQSFAQLQYTRRLTSKSLFNTTVFYNRLNGEWDLDLAPLGFGTDVLNYQLSSNFYGILSNFKYVSKKLTANIGLSGNMYNREHAMGLQPDVNTLLYTNIGNKNEVSGFTKLNYDVNRFSFYLDGQVRYVTFQYTGDVNMPNLDWLFVNPKAGLTYKQTNNLKFYVSVGQSHREPTRNDMFGGEDNLITYTEVKPETVIDYELGGQFKKGKLQFNMNGYYMDFKNEITLIGALGSNGLPLMTNVDKSFRSGIELELKYTILSLIKFSNNTNLSYNRINDNGKSFRPLYTPSLISYTSIGYEHKGLYVGTSVKANGKSYIDFDNTHTIPAFVVVDFDLGYTYKNYTIMGKISNVTNQTYFTNGYVVSDTRYLYVNAPLSGYLTLKIKL
jgi:iron complex outermembrane receptor protein